MIRIILAEDHPIVRRGLREILAEEPDMIVVGEAQNAEEMLALIRDDECEVLVTDVCMPGRSGLDALKEVKREYPTLPVLVLSVHAADQFGVQALRLGASGYLCKEHVTEELVRAIRKIVNGERHITATLAEKLASHLRTETDRSVRQMPSVRERRETRQELHRNSESTGLGRWRLPSPALQAV